MPDQSGAPVAASVPPGSLDLWLTALHSLSLMFPDARLAPDEWEARQLMYAAALAPNWKEPDLIRQGLLLGALRWKFWPTAQEIHEILVETYRPRAEAARQREAERLRDRQLAARVAAEAENAEKRDPRVLEMLDRTLKRLRGVAIEVEAAATKLPARNCRQGGSLEYQAMMDDKSARQGGNGTARIDDRGSGGAGGPSWT